MRPGRCPSLKDGGRHAAHHRPQIHGDPRCVVWRSQCDGVDGQVWGFSMTPCATLHRRGRTLPRLAAAALLVLAVLVSAPATTKAATQPPSSGNAWAWGEGYFGQLGNGSTTASSTPVAVSMPAGVTFSAVSADGQHSLALDSSGHAWAWGNNLDGELGNGGATARSSTPVTVTMPAGVTFSAVAAGSGDSLALDSSGHAWAWGGGWYGELGNGSTTNSSTPVAVSMPAGVTFSAVSAGGGNSLALDSSGHAWAWGYNGSGQLGNGSPNTTNSSTPVAVSMPAGVTFSAVAAGGDQSLALDSSGHAWAWGSDNSSTPMAVTMPAGVTFIAAAPGGGQCLALDSSGHAWAWGSNSSTPVAVTMPAGVTFRAVAAAASYSLALDSSGHAWAWGSGPLGNGSTTDSSTPVAVTMPAGVTFSAVSAGYRHSLALAVAPPTALTSSPNPSTVGHAVTYTATVSPTPDGGTVAFTDNNTTLSGCAAVAVNTSTGKATCTTSYSAVGSHAIVASYSGDPNYAASSGSLTQQVNAAAAPTTTYVLDGWGGLHPFGGAPAVSGTAYWQGWDIARGIALDPCAGQSGGYVLDGWGGLHPFGSAPAGSGTAYWQGWDIARGIVLQSTGQGGYVLDGWGGLNPFGGAPAVSGTASWHGWDIARGIVLQSTGQGGDVLDGWGGLHPCGTTAGEPPTVTAYWSGWNIARGLVLSSDTSGYVLDGWGGVHPFGGAPAVSGTAYWQGWDIARGISP